MQGENDQVNALPDNVQLTDTSTRDNAVVGDGRRTRWTGHRQRRRLELIHAAIAAILTHGPDVDMSHVALEAGVSKPVLYRYFTDKSQLWVAVGEHVVGLVVDAVTPAVAAVTEERALIASTVDAYLGTIEAQPQLYRFLSISDVPGIHHVVTRAMHQVAIGLARVIGDRLRALGLDSGAAEPWAHGMVGMVQSVGDWWISRGQPVSRPALTDYLTTLLWEGVAGLRAAASRHDPATSTAEGTRPPDTEGP